MKQIEVNPSNKPYYSEDFIKGFECGTKTQFEADRKELLQKVNSVWTPVTKELPDAPFPCYVSCREYDDDEPVWYVHTLPLAYYGEAWHHWSGLEMPGIEVVAWMPVMKPYIPEKEGAKDVYS